MGYKCEEQLLKKLEELKRNFVVHNIKINLSMIRDYMIKANFIKEDMDIGKLVIYYSPKKDAYTYKNDNDMKKDIFDFVLDTIEGKNTDANMSGILEKKKLDDVDNNKYKIYVDGSYMNNKVGYGAVVLEDDTPIKELYGEVTEDYAIQSRQVGGEIFAVQEGLKWCENKGIKKASVYYDFQNLEKWATGEYKTNNTLSKNYKSFIDSCNVSITWYKVKSHTGVEWNEVADKLAKKGII